MQTPPHDQIRWWTPLVVCPAAILMGIFFGATSNALNGRISPEYFEAVMRWSATAATELQWAIQQGILEGGISGAAFGVVFSMVISASTLLRCPLPFAMMYLLKAFAIIIVCWTIGGFAGMLVAWQMPSAWRGGLFIRVPRYASLLRFSWVGGSINGAYLGALLALLFCSIGFHLRWKKLLRSGASQGFPVMPV